MAVTDAYLTEYIAGRNIPGGDGPSPEIRAERKGRLGRNKGRGVRKKERIVAGKLGDLSNTRIRPELSSLSVDDALYFPLLLSPPWAAARQRSVPA